MAISKYEIGQIPIKDKVTDEMQLITDKWQRYFRFVKESLDPLGTEKYFSIVNNQSSPADVVYLSLNSSRLSQAIIEYVVQRVTTGSGATEIIYSGSFNCVYKPTSNTWEIQNYDIPNAGTFTAATTDICTKTAHGFEFGQIAQLTTSGTLPGGLSLATNYYVVPQSVDTFKLSTSLANAKSGSFVDITSTGSGTHTITPNPGVFFSITNSGQVQYTSSNITGTPSISKMSFRIRVLSVKNYQYSGVGPIA